MRTYFRILSDVRFAALSVGQMVSLLGDVMFPMAVLFAALQNEVIDSELALLVGTAYAVRFAALAAVVLFAGGILDRVDPVRSAATADLVRVFAFGALVLWWNGGLTGLIIAMAAMIGACEAVSEPAILVIGPMVVERDGDRQSGDRADAAIGLMEALRNMFGVAGPPLAALLLASMGYRTGLAGCAAVFAVSAVLTLWAGSACEPSTKRSAAQDDDRALAQEALTGLGIVWRRPWLRYVQMLAVAQVLFAVGPWMVALPIVITNADSDGVRNYGLVLAAFAAGAILGSLIGGRVSVRRPGLIALPCLAVFGVAALATGLSAQLGTQLVAYFLAGVGTQIFDILKLRAIRRSVPENEHARAFSADFFFSFAALPLGQIIGTTLVSSMGAETVLAFGGIFVLATGLIPLSSREVREFGLLDSDAEINPYPHRHESVLS